MIRGRSFTQKMDESQKLCKLDEIRHFLVMTENHQKNLHSIFQTEGKVFYVIDRCIFFQSGTIISLYQCNSQNLCSKTKNDKKRHTHFIAQKCNFYPKSDPECVGTVPSVMPTLLRVTTKHKNTCGAIKTANCTWKEALKCLFWPAAPIVKTAKLYSCGFGR